MAGGRPTDYKVEFCDRVIELGRLGRSRSQMCADLEICKGTMQNWEAAHPEFLAATARARALSQDWWETKAQEALENKDFNAALWAKSMPARFPDDYSDRQKIDHSSTDGTMTPPSAIIIRPYDPSKDG